VELDWEKSWIVQTTERQSWVSWMSWMSWWESWWDWAGKDGQWWAGRSSWAEMTCWASDELARNQQKKKAKPESLLTSSPCHSTPTTSSTLMPDIGIRMWKSKEKDKGNRKKESHQLRVLT
jgi:hypothetical protein